MPETITIREYGHLFCGEDDPLSRNEDTSISRSAFDFLRDKTLSQKESGSQFLVLSARNGRESLQVRNYVGVISTPDGTIIEILPKHTDDDTDTDESRKLLWKMLRTVHDISWLSSTDANLRTKDKPLPELLVERFLSTVRRLAQRGVRSDYQRVQETRKFLKGRLDLNRQLRRRPGSAAEFCIEFDAYTVNRPENRLIKLALNKVSRWRLGVANTRLAKELLVVFAEVEPSDNTTGDFSRWRRQRDMAHYQPVRPWLDLILNERSPWSLSGTWEGISMLFPMEQLFERYLEKVLRREITSGYNLKGQAGSEYLARHKGQKMFQLRPDLLIKQGSGNVCVMDAKWKLLDQDARDNKYGLSQSDLYQLFAYGHRYLGGNGDMLLIYPRHADFMEPLDDFFNLGDGLRLWVVPFDLDTDDLLLPKGLDLPWLRQRP